MPASGCFDRCSSSFRPSHGRKTLVLISAGMIASDVPGGRPDISELGMQVGKEAARSNTSIYTLFLDTSTTDRFQAQVRGADKNLQSVARDSEILGRWLDQFSGEAGGALFKVQVGSGEVRVRSGLERDRPRTTCSASSRRGRSGRPNARDQGQDDQKNVVIRGRRWVMVPKRGAAASENPSAGRHPSRRPRRRSLLHRRAVSSRPTSRRMADAFDRGEPDFQRGLADTPDLANLLRNFRGSDAPWPDAPRRTAVFALELAVAALRSDNQNARDEGGRLLAEYNVRLRQPEGADAFECSWLWTEVAALEGLFMPDSAMLSWCPEPSSVVHVRRGCISRTRSSPSSNGCAAPPVQTRRPASSTATRRRSSFRRPPRKPGCGRRGFSAGSASSMRRWRSSTRVRPPAPIRTCSI